MSCALFFFPPAPYSCVVSCSFFSCLQVDVDQNTETTAACGVQCEYLIRTRGRSMGKGKGYRVIRLIRL